MALQLPNLDDRDFAQLMADARRQIVQSCPDWTDLSPSDPGMVLLEVMAHMTETMIYRVNRLPEKAYVAFVRLMGLKVQPPAAAVATLRFSRSRSGDAAIEIPRGTQVTTSRATGADAPTFVTARAATIKADETSADVLAYHCEVIEAEPVGKGMGLPGLSVTARRPPIIAPTGDPLDLIVGVEAAPRELAEGAPAIQHDGKAYRIWREVDNFTAVGPDSFAYAVDRMTGVITFAPAVRRRRSDGADDGALEDAPQTLAAIPAADREIRAWYRRGGGPNGNVAANTLTVLRDPIQSVQVTNPEAATGGRAAETLENALARGPLELHSLQRAVTASDFELVTLFSSRAVARAKAFTKAALWKHASPGTVDVLLVPHIDEEAKANGPATLAGLRANRTEQARLQIQGTLDERRPLGTTCLVNWARYKPVRVQSRIVVGREEDQTAVKQRVLARLYQTINPLPTSLNGTGWPFGWALRASNVYDIALAEPGVRWVDEVKLLVDEVPDGSVPAVAADAWQPRMLYAGSGSTLFRSMNDGEGWEAVGRFEGQQIDRVEVHPNRAGIVAVSARMPDGNTSRLHLSLDCGETWQAESYTTAFAVNDLAWVLRNDVPVLLMATNAGLYELSLRPNSSPIQVLVDPARQKLGFDAIAAATDVRGGVTVAVAAQGTLGVYLSSDGGQPNTFRKIGPQGEDIRVLAAQYDGPRAFLWAGVTAAGEEPGKGCFRWELRGSQDPPDGWQAFGQNWSAGSCRGLAFRGTTAYAGSHRGGVLELNTQGNNRTWQPPDVDCGLPLRDKGRFEPVTTVAVDPSGRVLLSGGPKGAYRNVSDNEGNTGRRYLSCSSKEFADKVTLPDTWLFVSGEHDITILSEDEAR
jgi:hypothetical protein